MFYVHNQKLKFMASSLVDMLFGTSTAAGSVDETVNYSVVGGAPITDSYAGQIVNDWAATLSNGWDSIRAMGLGLIQSVYIDGQYWTLNITGNNVSYGNVTITVTPGPGNAGPFPSQAPTPLVTASTAVGSSSSGSATPSGAISGTTIALIGAAAFAILMAFNSRPR